MSRVVPPRDHPGGLPLARLCRPCVPVARRSSSRAPAGRGELLELLARARATGTQVSVVGSGSNLLIADEGVAGLVVKLDRELAQIEPRATPGVWEAPGCRRWRRGAGRAVGHRVRRQHPRHGRGRVRMNANAYGGELARVLEWVEIATAAGVERRAPRELGLSYRRSSLASGEIVTRASFDRYRRTPPPSQRHSQRCGRVVMAQPQGIKTFGSSFKGTPRIRARRVAARGCCWPRPAATAWPSGERVSPPSTPTSSRTPGLLQFPRTSWR